ncbi:MAG: hypothetical protein KDB14_22255 [Planctomycetales bacterium]|nr:hypothetical protein [Planctomycetales bacterium]
MTPSPMTVLGCGELADIVAGRLRLGSMPPLGGRWEPVGALATACEEVRAGSLFWALESAGQGAHRLEEAFIRGATGAVLAGRPATPFDGAFLIEVDDATEALCRWARSRRTSYEGAVVLCDRQLPACAIQAMLNDELPADSADQLAEIRIIEDAALSLVRKFPSQVAVLPAAVDGFRNFDEISDLCCPDLVCIYALSDDEEASGTTRAGRRDQATGSCEPGDMSPLAADNLVLVNPRRKEVRLSNNRTWGARQIGSESFELDGDVLPIGEAQLPLGLACWGIAKATGMPFDSIADRLQGCRAQRVTPLKTT